MRVSFWRSSCNFRTTRPTFLPPAEKYRRKEIGSCSVEEAHYYIQRVAAFRELGEELSGSMLNVGLFESSVEELR